MSDHSMTDSMGDAGRVVDAFDQIPAAIGVFDGPDQVIVVLNAAARAILGAHRDVLGMPLRDATPELASQEVFQLIEHVYESGEPFVGKEYRLMMDVDGDGELEELFIDSSVLPMRGTDGEVVGVLNFAIDVTQSVVNRRRAESRATEAEERYRAAHEVVLELQRNLLPEHVPVLPGVRIAAQYMVAGTEQSAGGDWFDALPLADGRVVLIVGDVAGHGPAASAVMGQLRAVLVQHLLEGEDLIEAVEYLDRFAFRLPAARSSTLCAAVVDPADGRMSYVNCGHLPPLIMEVDHAPRLLATVSSRPLGVGDGPRVVESVELGPGAVVVLYSDGLVERRGRPLEDGFDALVRVAQAARDERVAAETTLPPTGADRIAEVTVERLTRGGYDDDVTLLVGQLLTERPEPLTIEVAAEPGQIGQLRERLGSWLISLGAVPEDVTAIQLAVGEAVTNVVVHAYADTEGLVAVEGVLLPSGVLEVSVADEGSWRPAPSAVGDGGRGILLMHGFMDEVDVSPGEQGTIVRLRRRLKRPAVINSGPRRSYQAPDHDLAFEIEADLSGEPWLAVSGPVDLLTVDELRNQIFHVSRGGQLAVVLDLGGVTQLSSVAVRLLHDLAAEVASDSGWLRLVAPPGSIAREVLLLTGLDLQFEVLDAAPRSAS